MQKLEDHNCCLMFEVEWEVRFDACDLTTALQTWQPAVASQPQDQFCKEDLRTRMGSTLPSALLTAAYESQGSVMRDEIRCSSTGYSVVDGCGHHDLCGSIMGDC